jgi:predicted metal-dependent phosphoesterase TrpH
MAVLTPRRAVRPDGGIAHVDIPKSQNRLAADLHVHSTCSDGTWPAVELIRRGAQIGLGAVCIADHDSIDGVPASLVAARALSIGTVAGVELSASFESSDVHILGYCVDIRCARFVSFVGFLKDERIKRAARIMDKLRQLGCSAGIEEVCEYAGAASVGRPHIAEVISRKGFVQSYAEAFRKYLNYNGPAYVPKYRISIREAVGEIQNAGGLAFLAHPGLLGVNEKILSECLAAGIDGVEVVHPRHSPETTEWLRTFALRHSLLESGGSDFHGEERGDAVFGSFTVPWTVFETIRRRAETPPCPPAHPDS